MNRSISDYPTHGAGRDDHDDRDNRASRDNQDRDSEARESRGGDGFRGIPQDRYSSSPRRQRRRLPTAAALVLSLLLTAAATAAILILHKARTTPWPPPGWLFAACDVGQGDALALAAGPATAVVVDTGPDPAKADHCLSALGVRKIPLLLLTHFHADHVDGVPGVLHDRAVTEIETTGDPDPPRGAREVASWATSAGIRTTEATAGERREYGPLSWDVLWPDPTAIPPPAASPTAPPKEKTDKRRHHSRASPRHGEEGSGPNNASVVLQVTIATRDGPIRILLTGDIEPPAQQAVLAAHPDLAADVLKVPHHGSAHQDPDLFAAVHPRVAVISAGAGNTYGHPAPHTLDLATGTGARVFRTDRDGQIVVFGTAAHLRVATKREET